MRGGWSGGCRGLGGRILSGALSTVSNVAGDAGTGNNGKGHTSIKFEMCEVLLEVAYLLEERGDVFCIVWGTIAGHVTDLSTVRGTTNSRQHVKSLEYRWKCAVLEDLWKLSGRIGR